MKQILGEVTKEVAEFWQIPEYANKKIVMYPDAKRHCEKRHLNDFDSKETFYYILSNLDYIIKNPDYVCYTKRKSTLEYYKKLGQNIAVMVRVEEGKELRVKTFFPVTDTKLNNKKNKEAWNKYYAGSI